LQASVNSQEATISTLQDRVNTQDATISTLQDTVTSETSTISTLQSDLDEVLSSDVMALNPYLTVSESGVGETPGPLVQLAGVNLQIVNGTGSTNSINGLGNLIIGYNEANTIAGEDYQHCSDGQYSSAEDCGSGVGWSHSHKSGSHYLVTGSQNNYSQYGGIVAGFRNFSTRAYSTVTGGDRNAAKGSNSSISGGSFNQTHDLASEGSVSGGSDNEAVGEFSSVSGGIRNIAHGHYSSVSGGRENRAGQYPDVNWSSISGGEYNWTRGNSSSISGGQNRRAPDNFNWAAGDRNSDG
jgi:uncharacterized coiled-coil protein SlyX